ncbi:unnamed protein product [Peniophora sp. CBMAI 1063]|nr:unnamed protein product [Peniophora sp. CBMAI 1063]
MSNATSIQPQADFETGLSQGQVVSFYEWRTVPVQEDAPTLAGQVTGSVQDYIPRYSAQPVEVDTRRNREVQSHDQDILADALNYLRLTLDARPPVPDDDRLSVNRPDAPVLAPVLTYLNNVAVREICFGKRSQRELRIRRTHTLAYARYHAAAGALQMRDLLFQGLHVFYHAVCEEMLILEGNRRVLDNTLC